MRIRRSEISFVSTGSVGLGEALPLTNRSAAVSLFPTAKPEGGGPLLRTAKAMGGRHLLSAAGKPAVVKAKSPAAIGKLKADLVFYLFRSFSEVPTTERAQSEVG